MAFSSSAFLVLTVDKASATSSVVEFISLITASAAVTASSAAVLAASYLSAVACVFPAVTFVSWVNVFKSSLAFSNSAVFPLSFNKVAAFSNSALILSTSIWASVASTLPAFTVLSNTALAWAFAAVNAVFNVSYFASYFAILFGVLPVLSASVSAFKSFCSFVFWASVAATTNSALAAFNSALLAFTSATAWATWSTVACSSSMINLAFLASSSAALLAILYSETVSGVLPGVGSSSTNSSSLPVDVVNVDLSTFNAFCASKVSVNIFLYASVGCSVPSNKAFIASNWSWYAFCDSGVLPLLSASRVSSNLL